MIGSSIVPLLASVGEHLQRRKSKQEDMGEGVIANTAELDVGGGGRFGPK
jgi:hypothetical protein